jgi:sRNA-binding protein
MAGPITKRQKEHARLERRQEKQALRTQRKEEKASRPEPAAGVDPDIAHIVPGPQPLPETT